MAKQDLVVKLMLDSGAFGQDIREAERKAKEFSDGIKSVGKTTGDFAGELGLATNAFSKLGGVLTGAAGVVAAIGAFKSIMESSYGTAKEFHGTIAGFEGALDSFQNSLATCDFTTFTNGLKGVYRAAKAAKEAIMEAQMSSIAYGFINKEDRQKLKSLEVEFRDANTTDARRKQIKTEAETLLDTMRGNALNLADDLYAAVFKQMQAKQTNLVDMGKDESLRMMREALLNILTDYDEEEKAQWAKISTEITRKWNEYDANNKTAAQYRLHGGSQITERARQNWANTAAEYQAKANAAKAEYDKLVADNQELMFRNVLYNSTPEQLEGLITQIEDAYEVLTAIDEMQLQVQGWSAPAQAAEAKKAIEGSIGHLEEEIKKMKLKRKDEMVFESDEYKAQTEAIKKKQAALDAMIKTQKMYDGELEDELEIIEGTMLWYSKQIEEKEKLVQNLDDESEEWKEATAQIKEYTAALDALLEKYGEAIGKPVKKSGSSTSTKTKETSEMEKKREQIMQLAEMRKNVEKGSEEWENLTAQIKAFIAEYAKFEKAESESDPLKRMVKKLANANMILASTVSVFDAMSEVFDLMEDKTGMIMSGITNMLSTFATTAMNLIQIQQAAIATNNAYATSIAAGEAAKLPYPANLAAIATVIATMVSVGAQIAAMAQKANKFAEGGIVGGTSYSGDKLFAMVNSGEMILNKRQQRNLGNMLGGGGGQVEFHISGDSLVGVLNNRQNKRHLTR